MNEVDRYINEARAILKDSLHLSGAVLYSSVETLKPADIVLIGLNPGGETGPSIGRCLDELPSRSHNAYLDESWENRSRAYEAGQAPLQKRVQFLLASLGYDTRSVCSLNLIFRRTNSADDLDFWNEANHYWPVHQHLFELIRPKLILTFGNSNVSAYSFLKSKLASLPEKSISAQHGNWRCKSVSAQYSGQAIQIVGVPHLSRFSPEGKPRVIKWIRERLET